MIKNWNSQNLPTEFQFNKTDRERKLNHTRVI